MRKVIDTRNGDFDWQEKELLEKLLNVSRLPRFLILETVEEEEN